MLEKLLDLAKSSRNATVPNGIAVLDTAKTPSNRIYVVDSSPAPQTIPNGNAGMDTHARNTVPNGALPDTRLAEEITGL